MTKEEQVLFPHLTAPQELLLLIDNESSAAAAVPEATLSELMRFIVDTHHVFTRDSLATLQRLSKQVRDVHGANHPVKNHLAFFVAAHSAQRLQGDPTVRLQGRQKGDRVERTRGWIVMP